MNFKVYLYYILIPHILKYMMILVWLIIIPLIIWQFRLHKIELKNGVKKLKTRFGFSNKRYKARHNFWSRKYYNWHRYFDDYFSDQKNVNYDPRREISHLRSRYNDPYKTKMYQSAQDHHQSMFDSLMNSYVSNGYSINSIYNNQAKPTNYGRVSPSNYNPNDIRTSSENNVHSDRNRYKNKISKGFKSLNHSSKLISNHDRETKNSHYSEKNNVLKRGAEAYFLGHNPFKGAYNEPYNYSIIYRKGYELAKNGFQSPIYKLIFKHYSRHYSYSYNDLLIFLSGQLKAQKMINGINDACNNRPRSHYREVYYDYGYRTINELRAKLEDKSKLSLKACVLLVMGHITKYGMKLSN